MHPVKTITLFVACLVLIAGCQSSPTKTVNEITVPPVAFIHALDNDQKSLQFQLDFTIENSTDKNIQVEVFAETPAQTWTSLGIFTESPVTFIADGAGLHKFIGLAIDSAGNRQTMPNIAQAKTMVPEPIIITDLRGEDFDITNAVLRHNMITRWWGHGIGRDTIRPINNPQFLVPGDSSYPSDNNTSQVMGMSMDGENRAYGLNDILDKEVVNDVIGDVHFSATY